MVARPRRNSRLAQKLRQEEQSATRTGRSDMEELHASGKSAHSTLRSHLDSSPSRNSITSSLSQQKTPARSYYHRSVHNHLAPIDIVQDNSREVREDTAELASWALSDKRSFDDASSPTRASPSPTLLLDNDARTLGRNLLKYSHTENSSHPNVITEVSEPVSPSSAPSSRKSPGMSALSEMFKSTPPKGENNSSIDEANTTIDDSRFDTVTVREGIISQPTEQTALLLDQQVQRLNLNNRHSYLGDLENQKTSQHTTTETRFKNILTAMTGYSRTATARLLHPKSWQGRAVWHQGLLKPASYIPAVILGLLLNILDALSYGQWERSASDSLLIGGQA
ncbi:MAG: hypothetical protein LQ337_004882 [Flavoplaca oasis]|nr:MAG: hypothetical protein LQ337_004882 [Flavoplaca oasis]